MPLSNSKVEQVTTEDLAELSEIEKHNLGQVWSLSLSSTIDSLYLSKWSSGMAWVDHEV